MREWEKFKYLVATLTSIKASLGKYAKVFQTEVKALQLCAEEILILIVQELMGRRMTIYCGSQAALKSLSSHQIVSIVVWHYP